MVRGGRHLFRVGVSPRGDVGEGIGAILTVWCMLAGRYADDLQDLQ